MAAANSGSVGRGKAFQPKNVNRGMNRVQLSLVGTSKQVRHEPVEGLNQRFLNDIREFIVNSNGNMIFPKVI